MEPAILKQADAIVKSLGLACRAVSPFNPAPTDVAATEWADTNQGIVHAILHFVGLIALSHAICARKDVVATDAAISRHQRAIATHHGVAWIAAFQLARALMLVAGMENAKYRQVCVIVKKGGQV